MPRQILLQLPRPHIPHLERRVLGAAHQQPAVRTETRHIHGPHVAFERGNERPVARVPELDMVVKARAGDVLPLATAAAAGGEGDVVHALLMAQETGEGLVALRGGVPEVHGAVVARGDEALTDAAVDRGGFLEAGSRLGDFFGVGGWDGARVVVVGGAEDEVGRKREVVDPVGVRGEGLDQGSSFGAPDLNGLVLRCGVDVACPAPAHAGYTALVPAEHHVRALGDDVPNPDRGVLGSRCQPAAAAFFAEEEGLPGKAVDPFRVTFHRRAQGLTSLRIPCSDRVIHASRCNDLFIG